MVRNCDCSRRWAVLFVLSCAASAGGEEISEWTQTATLSAPEAFQAAAADDKQLRVLSYNIHHAEGVDRKLDVERIAKIIKSVTPDLVALQEVDRGTSRSDRVDQPEELAHLTGLHVVFEKNIEFQGGQYGNATLSRFPPALRRNIRLPNIDDGEQRGVLITELEPDSLPEKLLFLNTHLDHRSDDRERLASAEAINDLVVERPAVAAILAGDLNARIDSVVLREFSKQWTRAGAEELPTFPVADPQRQVDFILFRPADRWKVVDVRVLDEAVASDHRAIFAVLELRD